MNKLIAFAGLVLALFCQPAFAQEVTGQWQGTLHGAKELRIILKVSKTAGGALSGEFYSIDQTLNPAAVSDLVIKGSTLSFAVPLLHGSYTGELSKDRKSVKGAWTQQTTFSLDLVKPTAQAAWAIDPTVHKVSFITTSDHVKLEVLDWGGTGRPVVFIPGLGANAHVFDKFIEQLKGKYHLYGVTRRGYGVSDHPDPATADYSADRMGDDVLAAIDALKLEKPVLAGWSLGGEEMSSIGSRHPEKVSALIYLDAGYAYSFYAPGNQVPAGSNLYIDANDIKAKIGRLNAQGVSADQALAMIDELLNTAVPQLQADLQAAQKTTRENPSSRPPPGPPPPETPDVKIAQAILVGEQKYTKINVPILAIFASPHATPPGLSEAARASFSAQEAAAAEQVKRFETGLPNAKVVRLANAQHAVFSSNPADVAREMTTFIDGLK